MIVCAFSTKPLVECVVATISPLKKKHPDARLRTVEVLVVPCENMKQRGNDFEATF